MKFIFAILLVVVFSGCAEQAFWVKNGGNTNEFNRTQAGCHSQTYFLPQSRAQQSAPSYQVNTYAGAVRGTAYSTVTPYQSPAVGMADALGHLAAALDNIAKREAFMNDCMTANGWKKIFKSEVSVTVSTFALVGVPPVTYEGTATGYIDRTGIIKVKNGENGACVGTFKYTKYPDGVGLLRCDDGDSAEIKFKALSSTSGYGAGISERGNKIKFVFGVKPEDRDKYLSMTAMLTK